MKRIHPQMTQMNTDEEIKSGDLRASFKITELIDNFMYVNKKKRLILLVS